MILGPVFAREATTLPRRPQHYLVRSVYLSALLLLACTCWLLVAGTQVISNTGDMAWFGAMLFQIVAPLQLMLTIFFAAISTAGAIAQEKDKRTLILLLMTSIRNSEVVLGKLFASLLNIFAMIASALPFFMMITLFGGVSNRQVATVFIITTLSAVAAGSLGGIIAFWREKTFQTIALTALTIAIFLGLGEAIHNGLFGPNWGSESTATIAAWLSPLRAVLAASKPSSELATGLGIGSSQLIGFLFTAAGITVLLNVVAIVRLRVWNPSREVRRAGSTEAESGTWDGDIDASLIDEANEAARASHVDGRQRAPRKDSRKVWDNPVLWREVCTWAYGRKVLIIKLAYVAVFAMIAYHLHGTIVESGNQAFDSAAETNIPAAAKPMAPLLLISLVIVNALAVNAITNERDGQALELLLATDISPVEFIFGKLGGILWVTKEMVVLPLALCLYLWWQGVIGADNLLFLLAGLAVMYIYVATLGIHCGMTYAGSRTAISISLGTVFFLFVGVITCILIMVSFSSSFQIQLAPFLAMIVGGGIGLFAALGARNPSTAIGLGTLPLPFVTLYAITSFLLDAPLTVFISVTAMYGFATAAMLVPAIYTFDFAMGRTKGASE